MNSPNAPLLKYLLVQIPGWIITGVVVALLRRWVGLPLWTIPAAVAVSVVKDLIVFPVVRRAFEDESKSPGEDLVGRSGVATSDVQATGYVRVRGELWKAQSQTGELIPASQRICIRAIEGMKLLVVAEQSEKLP